MSMIQIIKIAFNNGKMYRNSWNTWRAIEVCLTFGEKACRYIKVQNEKFSEEKDSFYVLLKRKYSFRQDSNPRSMGCEANDLPQSYLTCWYFYTEFCSKLVTICHFMTIAYTWLICKHIFCTWYTLFLCPFISKSVVDRSLRNLWIGGSNPGGNYTSFSV